MKSLNRYPSFCPIFKIFDSVHYSINFAHKVFLRSSVFVLYPLNFTIAMTL